jgi:hypothetical protein
MHTHVGSGVGARGGALTGPVEDARARGMLLEGKLLPSTYTLYSTAHTSTSCTVKQITFVCTTLPTVLGLWEVRLQVQTPRERPRWAEVPARR